MNTKVTARIGFINTLIASLSLGLMGTVGHAADVAPASPLANKLVNYADLNLGNSEALTQLYRRISAAAHAVCGSHENHRSVADTMRERVCIDQSIARAVMTVNKPALTALLAAKTGRTTPNVVLANRQ